MSNIAEPNVHLFQGPFIVCLKICIKLKAEVYKW